jgi:hypothetical protein
MNVETEINTCSSPLKVWTVKVEACVSCRWPFHSLPVGNMSHRFYFLLQQRSIAIPFRPACFLFLPSNMTDCYVSYVRSLADVGYIAFILQDCTAYLCCSANASWHICYFAMSAGRLFTKVNPESHCDILVYYNAYWPRSFLTSTDA